MNHSCVWRGLTPAPEITRLLSNSPVVRNATARILFLLTAIVTLAILLGMNHLGPRGDLGLTSIYFELFMRLDFTGAMCTLLILVGAVLVAARIPFRAVLRWSGGHPNILAASSALVLCAGALLVYQNHPL